MRLILDTSAYSAFKRNHAGALDMIRNSQEIIFSSVVAGELLAGFRWGTRFTKNLQELRTFLEHPRVKFHPLTLSTADRYSRLYVALRGKGKPIPTNDMWLAAETMETGAQLLTADHHFDQVDGLATLYLD